MNRTLFVSSYLQVTWWAQGRKNSTLDLPKIITSSLNTVSVCSLEGWFQVLRGDTPGISSD